ncbi:MAG: Asp23/Gls24 family envelope stress response protein [Coriobacteriales bacterium]|nr:Asp23/Gls24 family envelope stress response protein [Coriobacteriales bacterium]
MVTDQQASGLTIGPGVVETIIALAAVKVDGVATVGGRGPAAGASRGLLASIFGKRASTSGVAVFENDDKVIVEVCVQVLYGYRLPDIAEGIRLAVADALSSQASMTVDAVNVTIDGIQFVA